MNKHAAKRKFLYYLKEKNVHYFEHLHSGESSIVMVLTGYTTCPDSVLECSIKFFDTCMENRVYYTENGSGWIKARAGDLSDIYRLLNFINARVWPFSQDGLGGELYKAHHLQTPRIYITEDENYDITATTVIDYDHYDMTPLEIEDYCTATIPELMSKLSPIFFFLLMKEITVDEAVYLIKRDMLLEFS
ncbi:hypothetical protein JOC59_000411 [Weissella beninensis]|uniref:Uncharacterized protein n=1 Tax=Periweissella beninensis TaxID=504936 RepID=A0ABT0VJU9_9LACO|nr:hypothetical protein [Periweissella beninensis]MBM7543711.1 hypothetical protein [Periweissella beninensis]MCM2436690.1 hypothetical protein [Periweissella beninensis]